ncbi:MAG: hypothetical protein KDI36_12795 [Pseudomonadales bacterium]|nr:hypothetical protein [Pseudomonadales bacterium]
MTMEQVRLLDDLPRVTADFNGTPARPVVSQIEFSALVMHDITIGLGYQQTDELLFAELPESRWSLVASREISDGIALSVEVFRDRDYASTDFATGLTGSGESSIGVVLQVAAEF